MIWGHTDLRISLSEAKFDAEADFDVRSAVAPPKPHQIDEKLIFRSENFAEKKMFGAEMFAEFFCSDIESIESIEPIDPSTDRSNRSTAAMVSNVGSP